VIDAEELAGSAESGLDLVGDEQNLIFVADLAQPWPVVIRRDHGPGFALNRFDDHASDAVTNRLGACQDLLDGRGITEGDLMDPFKEREPRVLP